MGIEVGKGSAPWRPSNHEYHADRSRWSSSMLKVFRQSPALAYDRYVLPARILTAKPRRTASLTLGSIVNALLLDRGADLYIVDVPSRRGKAFKEAERAFPDRTCVTRPEYAEGAMIAMSVIEPKTRGAEVCRALLIDRDGISEFAYRWDDASGVPCRLMADRFVNLTTATIVDLKSTRDPEERAFAADAIKFGYDAQMAFYRRGIEHLIGRAPDVYLVAVRNAPPYEAVPYFLGGDFLRLGAHKIENDLTNLAACLADDTGALWRSNPALDLVNDRVRTLEPPRWALRALDEADDRRAP